MMRIKMIELKKEAIDEISSIISDNLCGIEILFAEKVHKKIPVAEYYWHIRYKKRWIHDIIAVVVDSKLYMYPYSVKEYLTFEVLNQISYAAILL
jgi:hypothetical protein